MLAERRAIAVLPRRCRRARTAHTRRPRSSGDDGRPRTARRTAARLLVRRAEEDEVTLERHPRAFDREQRRELKDAGGFHVEGAATVEKAVADDAAEGIDRPIAPICIDDVDVMVENDPSQRAVAAQPRHQVARPGADSTVSLSIPSRASIAVRKRAPSTSLPGGFVVSIVRYRRSRSTVSSPSAVQSIMSAILSLPIEESLEVPPRPPPRIAAASPGHDRGAPRRRRGAAERWGPRSATAAPGRCRALGGRGAPRRRRGAAERWGAEERHGFAGALPSVGGPRSATASPGRCRASGGLGGPSRPPM